MFGEPVAVIAGRIGEACERYAARQRVGGGFSGATGFVEHAQAERQCGQSGQIEVGAEGVERHDEAIGAGRNGLISGFGMPNYFASTFARSNNQEEYRKPKIFVPAAPGLALWSLAARAARAWSLADGPTRVRSPSRCPRARPILRPNGITRNANERATRTTYGLHGVPSRDERSRVMSGARRRLKTLVGAASVLYAPGDADVAQVCDVRRRSHAGRRPRRSPAFTADLLQADAAGLAGTTGSQEPIVALAALSQATSAIGLVATVSTTYHHPYNLARLIGTLDHVSGGRAAWNAVTSSVGEENFGDAALPDPERRYARAAEFVEVVNALFDANDPRATRRGQGGGISVDPRQLGAIDYRGAHFQVQGPLNVPPSPQRRPVLFQAGQSASGVSLGAKYAEVVYTSQPTHDDARAFVAELHRQAIAFGRADRLPLVMNSFHSVIGESDADVARRLRDKHERIDYEQGRLKLADMLGGGVDLRELPLDQPLPASLLPAIDSVHRRRGRVAIFVGYARQRLTLRELIIRAQETGHWSVAGTPEQLADAIETRYRAGPSTCCLHAGQPTIRPAAQRVAARIAAARSARYRLRGRRFSREPGTAGVAARGRGGVNDG